MDSYNRSLVIRWGAYGDMLIALPFIEEVKRRSRRIHIETGDRGYELLGGNPEFNFTTFDVMKYRTEKGDWSWEAAEIRWKTLTEAGGWDFAINLWRTLEAECIAEEWQEEFFWPRERRQEKFGNRIFVEAPFAAAKWPVPSPVNMGTIYFPLKESLWMEHWGKKHRDDFVVAIVVAGSTMQKVPMGLKDVAARILKEYPETKFILLGTKSSGWIPNNLDMRELQFDFGKKNVMKMVGKTPFFQAMGIVKMADYVIGPVSALLHAAGTFGTPKTMICTDCSVVQACKYHHNDFSIQGNAPCCPCHRAIYNTKHCLTDKTPFGELPMCNSNYDVEKIMQGVAFAHGIKKERQGVDRIEGTYYSAIPDFKNVESFVQPPHGRYEFEKIRAMFEGRAGLNIVEVGTTRQDGNIFSDGYSTPYFSWWAKKDGHKFHSVDISPAARPLALRIMDKYGLNGDHAEVITGDGIKYLEDWDVEQRGYIDLVYLDGWDYGLTDYRLQVHLSSEIEHLKAAVIASGKVAPGGYMLVDDTPFIEVSLIGKGRLVCPFLLENGWEPILLGWQVLFKKPL